MDDLQKLVNKRCTPCENGATPLNQETIKPLLQKLEGWTQIDQRICKTFPFKNYYQTMAFVNAVAWLSHREDHHPDMIVGYSKCHIEYSTHSVNGLSENDFICAAKVDDLLKL